MLYTTLVVVMIEEKEGKRMITKLQSAGLKLVLVTGAILAAVRTYYLAPQPISIVMYGLVLCATYYAVKIEQLGKK